MEPRLDEVADGVARVSWAPAEGDFWDQVQTLRVAVEGGLSSYRRVEAWLDPADQTSHRLATTSGLRREGLLRGIEPGVEPGVKGGQDRVVYARLADDLPFDQPEGFRTLLNSFLPRKRAIAQLLVRDPADRVLLCQLTYKRDWDLPGGVVEVGESPRLAAVREVKEELDLDFEPGPLALVDWMPPWGGWDDAVCLVFDGGVIEPSTLDRVTREEREIRSVALCTRDEVRERCADFTARRVLSAMDGLAAGAGPAYVEGGGWTG